MAERLNNPDKRTLMAIDPGTTTGIAIYHPGVWQMQSQSRATWEWCQVQGHLPFWKLLTMTNPHIVIIERFQFQARQKAVLDAVEYIGITKLYTEATDKKLVMQTASQAKGLWTDEKLRKVELFASEGKHARDATRHMLYYLTVAERNLEFANRLKV